MNSKSHFSFKHKLVDRNLNKSFSLITRKFMTDPKGKISGRHWLTFTGIALGVMALLSVSSVMNGFDQDMRQRIIGTRAEIRLENTDASPLSDYVSIINSLEKLPYIKAASPVSRNELMLVKASAMAATICSGIDLQKQQAVSPVLTPVKQDLSQEDGHWLQGIVSGAVAPADFANDGIIIGADLAQSIFATVGDTLQLISPIGTIPTPLGMLPKTRSLRVVGIFIAGMPEYDRLYCYVPLSVGQYFSGYENMVDHIEIKTRNARQLFKTTATLKKTLPQYRIENWSSFDSSLYSAMHFEKYMMLVILGLMFIIASFNMSGNIYKTIVQKRRAIGILKTIGYRDNELLTLFLRHGLIIGLAGILTGIIASLILLTAQIKFGIIQLPVGNMPNLVLPVELRWSDYLIIPLIAFAITFVSIYLPARNASRINPIALIREIV
jgi:lipoprotein-releasing system permease protein